LTYQNTFQQTIFQGSGLFQGGKRTLLVDELERIIQRRQTYDKNVFQTNVFQNIPDADVDGYIKTMTIVRMLNELQKCFEPISAFQDHGFQSDVFQTEARKGVVRAIGAVKYVTDILNITERDADNAIHISHGFNKFVGETINLITNKLSYRDRYRHISDTVNISTIPTRLRARFRYATENMHVIDFDGRLKGIIRAINEIVNILEPISAFQNSAFQDNTFQTIARKGIVRAMGFVRFITPESMEIGEAASRLGLRIRFQNAIVNIATATHKAFGYNRFENTSVEISETTGKPRVMARITGSVVELSEQLAKTRTLIRYLNETINVSAIDRAFRERFRFISETVNITESKNTVRGWIFTIADGAMNIAEFFKRIRSHTIMAGGSRSTKLYNRSKSARLFNRVKSAKLFNRRRSSRGATRT
jgi:hypothetical protein